MSSNTTCTTMAKYTPGGAAMYDYIYYSPKPRTPEEFDKKSEELAKTLKYTLFDGSLGGEHALIAAAEKGNFILMKHILQQEGERLLSLGNTRGMVPLSWAVYNGNYESAETLIALKADVNMATAKSQFYNFSESPLGSTPLGIAVRIKNINLMKLLANHGGIPKPDLTDSETGLLDSATRTPLKNILRDVFRSTGIVSVITDYIYCFKKL